MTNDFQWKIGNFNSEGDLSKPLTLISVALLLLKIKCMRHSLCADSCDVIKVSLRKNILEKYTVRR